MANCEVGIAATLQYDGNVCSSPSQIAPVELHPGWL